jgi:hypothetical protein
MQPSEQRLRTVRDLERTAADLREVLEALVREAPVGSEQREHLERAYCWMGEVEREVGRALGVLPWRVGERGAGARGKET